MAGIRWPYGVVWRRSGGLLARPFVPNSTFLGVVVAGGSGIGSGICGIGSGTLVSFKPVSRRTGFTSRSGSGSGSGTSGIGSGILANSKGVVWNKSRG